MEGGAMRGMFTCGVIDVMQEAGITFDGAIGVSAGAVLGCNYKSEQIGRAYRYTRQYCKDYRYGSMKSFRKTGNAYDVDFCYHEIPEKLDVFDKEAFKANPMIFYAVATDVVTGKAVYHKCSDGEREDIEWLRASASMPLVSRVVNINGHNLLDGGIGDSIPLKFMEEQGFDRNVVILTQPLHYVKQKNKYEYTKDIIANTEKSSLNSSVLHKKYYIIISCYEEEINTQNYSRDEIQSMIFSELYTRARSIMRTLSRCEVNSKILDSKGLVELLYNAYNREDSDIFSAQTAINAGFDSLYSTAPDVIDKKMKLINKQIEENGTKLANEAVMEAKSDKEMMLRIREENAKNLIFDFAEQLISENEEYLGKDISEDAKVKVRRKKKEATEGGNENETNEKTKATRGRRPSSGNE